MVNSRPWNSIDLNGSDTVVRAARGGWVHFDNCGLNKGYIRIDHGDRWSTAYYHVINIGVGEGNRVERGTPIANQGDSVDCSPIGTPRPNAHVHFSIFYTTPDRAFDFADANQQVDLHNVQIGSWLVYRGAAQYDGCMVSVLGGPFQCAPNGYVINDGRVGGSVPALAYTNNYTAMINALPNNDAQWRYPDGIGWTSLQGVMTGNPAAVAFGGNLYLFIRGTDGRIYYKTQDPIYGTWSGPNWFVVDGRYATSDPVVVIYNGVLQLWVRGPDGAPWQNFYYSPGGGQFVWYGWTSYGGYMFGKPALLSTGSALRLVVRGIDDGLYQRYFNGSTWGPFIGIGGVASSDPVLSSNGATANLIVRGNDGSVYQNTSTSDVWTGFASLGGSIIGNPIAVQYGTQWWVVAHWTDGYLYQRVWDSTTGWGAWMQIPGQVSMSDPAMIVAANQVRLMVRSSDGNAWMNTNGGFGWTGWLNAGGPLA